MFEHANKGKHACDLLKELRVRNLELTSKSQYTNLGMINTLVRYDQINYFLELEPSASGECIRYANEASRSIQGDGRLEALW